MSDDLGGWGAYVDESMESERRTAEVETEREARPDEWRNIWVFAETRGDHIRSSVYELIGKARELADGLGVRVETFLAIGAGGPERAQQLIHAGADVVYLAQSAIFDRQDPDVTHQALVAHVRRRRPELLLFGQSTFSDSVASRLALALESAVVPRIRGIELDTADRRFIFRQSGYEGRVDRQAFIPKANPQIATVLRRSFHRPLPDPTRYGRVVEVMPEVGPGDLALITKGDAIPTAPVALERAPTVILIGKGIGTKDAVDAVRPLAGILDGAQLAYTRSAADLGYGDPERVVGITGRRVRPRLLISLGVSGDLDTLEGIDRSELRAWVAVDRDPESPIHQEADHAVVADWKPFVAALVQTLEGEKRALTY